MIYEIYKRVYSNGVNIDYDIMNNSETYVSKFEFNGDIFSKYKMFNNKVDIRSIELFYKDVSIENYQSIKEFKELLHKFYKAKTPLEKSALMECINAYISDINDYCFGDTLKKVKKVTQKEFRELLRHNTVNCIYKNELVSVIR